MPATEPPDPAAFLRDHVAPRSARRVTELRSQIARLQRELDDRLAAVATVEFALEGEGGGTWYLNLANGETTLSDRSAEPPIVRVRQTRTDWEALARAELTQVGGPAGGTDLTRSRITRLRTLDGALAFRLALDDDREARVVVQFGQGERADPQCVLGMRASDARRLQTGEIAPQAAFMQGLVRIDGDLAFAMQVGAALFL